VEICACLCKKILAETAQKISAISNAACSASISYALPSAQRDPSTILVGWFQDDNVRDAIAD
jgi:hypothetical protein